MNRTRFTRGVLLLAGVLALHPPLIAQEGEDASEPSGGILTVVSTESASQTGGSEPSGPMRLSMEFQDANLKDILKAFSTQTGINVIASEEIGERTVTLYLEDVTAMDALDQILQASGLAYERPAGSQIYIVRPKDDKPKIITITRVYPLRYARVSTSKLAKAVEQLSASSSSTASSLGSTSAASTTSTATTTTGTSSSAGGAAGVGIDKVIDKILTKDGKVVVDERTNRLIVTDIAENFPQIEAVINSLDIRTAQILVEVELLETTLSKLKDLGIEWGTGAEGNLVNFTMDNAKRDTRFPFGWIGHGDAPNAPTRFGLSTLSFADFDGVLQALESDADTKILARPKVLTLDNESAIIKLTSNQAVGFTSTAQATTGTKSTTPERTQTGVSLTVTPQVNEGGFVTMAVEPTVTKVVTASVTPPSDLGTVVDPKTRSAKVVVRVRNGDTLVLGGLIDRSDSETLRRVPVLSGIPILGGAFKNQEINDSASELVVFVSPRILTEPPATRMASVGPGPFAIREQENAASRQSTMEEVLRRLEQPRL